MQSDIPPIGVLAIQGDFAAHGRALEAAGAAWVPVRYPHELAVVSGLVLPGGESTTMIKGLQEMGLWEAIPEQVGAGMPLLATCAGLILAARQVTGPEQSSWNLLDVEVTRNAWGRQRESFIARASWPGFGDREQEMVFIRAPRITGVGPQATVLGRFRGEPVLVEQGSRLGATFHPELTPHHPVVDRFVERVKSSLADCEAPAG